MVLCFNNVAGVIGGYVLGFLSGYVYHSLDNYNVGTNNNPTRIEILKEVDENDDNIINPNPSFRCLMKHAPLSTKFKFDFDKISKEHEKDIQKELQTSIEIWNDRRKREEMYNIKVLADSLHSDWNELMDKLPPLNRMGSVTIELASATTSQAEIMLPPSSIPDLDDKLQFINNSE